MNKKGFMITPTEIFKLLVVLAFGIFAWMVYEGVGVWITDTFHLSIPQSIWIGIFGLTILLFLIKFRIYKFLIG